MTTCWLPSCGKPVDPAAAACPSCGSLLRIRDKYRVVRLIGQGGMGVVYEVIDERLGRRAALKMLHGRHAENSASRRRFETECRAMAALDHPGIARIYDADAHNDQLFFVQQLVLGRTLRQHFTESAGDAARASSLFAITLGDEVLGALEHAHAQGVIHRDVNLNNIMLVERAGALHPVIIDFGMARLSERGATRAAWGGTPGFAAPEQILDPDSNDRRSDLFAVAMVLYSILAAGATAFSTVLDEGAVTSPTALVRAYQLISGGTVSAIPLRKWNPDVAPDLEAVVMRGLSPRPEARYQTAQEMAAALRACRAEQADRSEPAAPAAAPPPPTPILASEAVGGGEPPVAPDRDIAFAHTTSSSTGPLWVFVDREREISRLHDYLNAALGAGGLHVCYVTGGAGSGKSSLLQELARQARARHPGLLCAFGECAAQTGPNEPFLPFRDMLLSLVGDLEPGAPVTREELETRSLARRALLTHAPRLIGTLLPRSQVPSTLLDALAKGPALAASQPDSARLDRDRVLAQVSEFTLAFTREAPLLLMLDNLQWIDSASVELLRHLRVALRDVRVLFVGAYRPSEILPGQHPIEATLLETKRLRGDVWIDLDSGGPEERRAFTEALLSRWPNTFSPEFRDQLFERTQGHPLFTTELLRVLRERGLLVQDAEGRWGETKDLSWPSLPTRVEGIVEERIRRLDDDLRETLTVAAVAGADFLAQVVALVRQRPVRDILRQLTQELDRKHRFVEETGARRTPQGLISEFHFRDFLVRQYLYDHQSESERMMLHGDIAAALEKLYGPGTPEIAAVLAHHYEAAGEVEKAIEHLGKAAEYALTVGGEAESRRLADRRQALIAERR